MTFKDSSKLDVFYKSVLVIEKINQLLFANLIAESKSSIRSLTFSIQQRVLLSYLLFQ